MITKSQLLAKRDPMHGIIHNKNFHLLFPDSSKKTTTPRLDLVLFFLGIVLIPKSGKKKGTFCESDTNNI